MGGCVVQVWFRAECDIAHPNARFELVETEMPDFASFCELVDADRLIGAATLLTHKGERNERIVHGRRPVAFRGSAVLRCQLPTWSIIDEEKP